MNQPLHRYKAQFFKALGHPARLAILDQLRGGERSVGELQAAIGVGQPVVSQQLARLRESGIVDGRRVGNTTYYSVRDPLLFKLLDVARQIFDNQLVSSQELLKQLRSEPLAWSSNRRVAQLKR
ncbi:MAG: ArsR/SmtB family transcription factor [Thermoflexales bacterium]